ncbi:hypothetical protein PILCRDRAFT_815388 [Piloderma croceum F 1598]|uniref:DEAD/DEAH box helicase domain-containing protein n=1 Tax=Piloderma croceum (strain F 1598) TaxID=765440 RepID=A0A0C3BKJ1_PILCF|nr:hypothetical protein PILCRDRAFT_815388 [Piloderma croceum F 1598]
MVQGWRGKYDSIQGHQLCKKILARYVTYDPHDYILDAVHPVIDGFNLLATTPTGLGKTGLLSEKLLRTKVWQLGTRSCQLPRLCKKEHRWSASANSFRCT